MMRREDKLMRSFLKLLFSLFLVCLAIPILLILMATFYPMGWQKLFSAIFQVLVPFGFLLGFLSIVSTLWLKVLAKRVSLPQALIIACMLACLAYLVFFLFTADFNDLLSRAIKLVERIRAFLQLTPFTTSQRSALILLLLAVNGTYFARRKGLILVEWIGVNLLAFSLFLIYTGRS